MKILYIVPYVPDKVRVRPYNLIRHLAACGHQVTVLALSTNDMEERSAQELRQDCAGVQTFPLPVWRSLLNSISALATPDPLQSYYCWQPRLAQQAITLTGMNQDPGFDIIHVEHLRGVRFGQKMLQNGNTHKTGHRLPVVWDSVDSISFLFEQAARQSQTLKSKLITWLELARTQRYEAKMAGLFDRTLVTSEQDRSAFLNLTGPSVSPEKIQVLPNGVDLNYFAPAPNGQRQKDTIVVSGKMSYHANVSMVRYLVEKIMPLIWSQMPEIKLTIVGKDPPKQIHSLAGNPNITVTGFVPDMRPYLRSATVAVAPLTYGAGIQNKVLEAMACGTPVVTTQKAISALQVKPGQDLLVADNPERFAEQVIRILANPSARADIAENAIRYVHRNHHWKNIAGRLECIYAEVIRLAS